MAPGPSEGGAGPEGPAGRPGAERPFAPATVAELWEHARALAEAGARELSPPHVRRALVTLAVAGSGGDVPAYEREVTAVNRAFRALGLDPVPLFDAAAALVAEDDVAARGVLVNLPRAQAPPPRRPINLR